MPRRVSTGTPRPQGEAVYETMEHWRRVTVAGDGKGHMTAKCVARDEPGMGSQLTFEIAFDQRVVLAMLCDLDELIRSFPCAGGPDVDTIKQISSLASTHEATSRLCRPRPGRAASSGIAGDLGMSTRDTR